MPHELTSKTRLSSPCASLLASCANPGLAVQGVEKIKLIIEMLEAGLHPMFSDLDVVWLRDPLPFVRLLDRTNMLVSSDSCEIFPDVRLDNCPAIVGTNRDVKGKGTYVGKMNVSALEAQLLSLAAFVISLLDGVALNTLPLMCWLGNRPQEDEFCVSLCHLWHQALTGGNRVAGWHTPAASISSAIRQGECFRQSPSAAGGWCSRLSPDLQ